jgi:hypothetical protein
VTIKKKEIDGNFVDTRDHHLDMSIMLLSLLLQFILIGSNVVHTARRYYRLNGLVRPLERASWPQG